MPDPFPPDPSDPHDRRRSHGRHPSLSAREREALRLIEADLARVDPGFTHRMRRADDDVTVVLPRRRRALVAAAIVGLVFLLIVVPSSWWVLYLLLALMAGTGWLLTRMTRSSSPPDPGP
jgi:hypothetical protein